MALKIDYFAAKPNFSISYANVQNIVGRRIDTYSQPIHALNGTLGVFYQFGQK